MVVMFLIFPRKQDLTMEKICMKCQTCFLGKIRKYFKMSSADFFFVLPRMIGVNKGVVFESNFSP